MRGHQQSSTRKLNRHWQSGGGGGRKVVSYYMHANYPNSAASPGTYNVNMLIPEPGEDEKIAISIDRSQRSSSYQEYLNHLQPDRDMYLFPSWYALGEALGYRDPDQQGNPTPSVHTTYYRVYEPGGSYTGDRYAYYGDIYRNQDKYKMINLLCGAYYTTTGPDDKLYGHFDYEHTRLSMLGPIYIPQANIPSGVWGYSEEEWPTTAEIMSKLHIWVQYPDDGNILLQPSSRTTTGPVRDEDGNVLETVTTNWFPVTFRIFGDPGSTYCYQEYMTEYPIRPHLHLPVAWAGRQVGSAPPYVNEYNPDTHRWGMVEMAGEYTKKIVIGGPFNGSSVPATSSPWYNKTFRQWMEIGEFLIHYDIDRTKTLEENVQAYAKTIR